VTAPDYNRRTGQYSCNSYEVTVDGDEEYNQDSAGHPSGHPGSADTFLACKVSGSQISLAPFNLSADPAATFETEVETAAKAGFNASDVGVFTWSPDQKWMAFEVQQESNSFIYATPAGNYRPVLIDKGWFPAWRPTAAPG